MKKLFKKRQKTRKLILQALYCLEISKNEIKETKEYILKTVNLKKIDIDYFDMLTNNIYEKKDILEEIINNLNKKNKIYTSIIENIIIKITIFELMFCLDIPYKVIINEAIELSKTFCSKQSHVFINKIADNLAKEIRNIN